MSRVYSPQRHVDLGVQRLVDRVDEFFAPELHRDLALGVGFEERQVFVESADLLQDVHVFGDVAVQRVGLERLLVLCVGHLEELFDFLVASV